MKTTIPKIAIENLDSWSSFYDDPEKARAAIVKHAARDYTAEADEKAGAALQRFYADVATAKKKLLASSVEYDLPPLIDAGLRDSGMLGREQAEAAPAISNAEGSVDYGALTPGAFESIADPARTHPYDRKNA